MSVVLTTPPPIISFSGDRIVPEFTCSNLVTSQAVKSGNSLNIGWPLALDTELVIRYGTRTINMVVSNEEDTDGTKFPPELDSNTLFVAFLRTNYYLNQDFNIYESNGTIIFNALRPGVGYDIALYNVGFVIIKNDLPGESEVLKANYTVAFRLFIQNVDHTGYNKIYDTNLSLLPGAAGRAEARIGDKLHSEMSNDIFNLFPDVPEDNPIECKKSCRNYYFEFSESFGEPVAVMKINRSEIYTVLHGGMSFIGQATKTLEGIIFPGSPNRDRFLKQGSFISATRTNQLQYLYFFNGRSTRDVLLRCRLKFTDGTKELLTLATLTLQTLKKYGFNISYDKIFIQDNYPDKSLLAYDVWLTDPDYRKLSREQSYILDYRPLRFIRYFMNWSAWGTFDSRMFYGKGSSEFELTQSEALINDPHQELVHKGSSIIFDVKLKSKFSITTGFIADRTTLIQNRDFFLSSMKYRSVGGNLLPVKVSSKTIAELEDKSSLFAQNFEYEYLFEDHAYTEGDIQEPGMSYDQLASPFNPTFLITKENKFLLTPQLEYLTL